MVSGKWYAMGSDLSVPLKLRMEVLGREADELDAMSQHVVVFDSDEPVGSARLWWADGAFRMGDIAVIESKRGRGFGDLLVRLLLYKALTHSASLICVDTPKALVPFFAQYGLTAAGEGNGIVTMSIRGDDVQLSHCGGNCADCGHRSPECVPKALREE